MPGEREVHCMTVPITCKTSLIHIIMFLSWRSCCLRVTFLTKKSSGFPKRNDMYFILLQCNVKPRRLLLPYWSLTYMDSSSDSNRPFFYPHPHPGRFSQHNSPLQIYSSRVRVPREAIKGQRDTRAAIEGPLMARVIPKSLTVEAEAF